MNNKKPATYAKCGLCGITAALRTVRTDSATVKVCNACARALTR